MPRRQPGCTLGAGVPTLRAAPTRRRGLPPGRARWRTVWTGPAAGGQMAQGMLQIQLL